MRHRGGCDRHEGRAVRLDEAFFRQDVLRAAPLLAGACLFHRLPDGRMLSGRITETEAYRGQEDLACHARFGRTARTEMLYRAGGYSYVYLVYGLHWLFNVVTGEENTPQGVLIRAMEKPLDGPAKWTKAFQITGSQNGLYLPDSEEIWIEKDGDTPVRAAPRIGVDYAPEPWKSMAWRFIAE